MRKQIENILQELYGIDWELKNREEELIQIIDSMINLKPNVKIDENFKEELRKRIMKEISIKKVKNMAWNGSKASIFQIFSYVFWTVWIAAFWFFMFKDTLFQDVDFGNWKQNIKFESKVTESKEWFWKLSDVWNQNNQNWWKMAMDNKLEAPVSAPASTKKIENKKVAVNNVKNVTETPKKEVAVSNNAEKSVKPSIEADTAVIDSVANDDISVSSSDWLTRSISGPGWTPDSAWSSPWYAWVTMDMGDTPPSNPNLRMYGDPMPKMIAPDDLWVYIPEVYRYSYSGNLNIDLKNTMPVYKRENKKIDSKILAESLANLDFAWVKLWNFKDIWVSNISLSEDKEYWYNIYVDFDNSSISISKNWNKWPQQPYIEWEKQVFLEEKEIVKIANDFLKAHKIDLSSYGTPVIEKTYMRAYAKYSSSRIMPEYAQNMTNVVFPLIVDWKEIVEEWWQVAWVRIEVDLKEKKVTSVNWLSIDSYLKSDYETETSTANLLKVAGKWWRYGFYDYGTQEVKYIDVKLKNPEIKYVHTYSFKDNVQEQFLVPAVVFDVEKPANTENFYGENVVVPLLKDSYKYDGVGNIIGTSK